MTSWYTAGLIAHQPKKAAVEGRARLRRLNRVEYVNTLRDLCGAELDIEILPEDGTASGFDNIDAALDLSPTLLERYLESADAALDAVFVKGPKPQSTRQHLSLVPIAKQLTKTNRPMPRYVYSTLIREDEVIFLGENEASKPLLEAKAPVAGLDRFRISANAVRQRNSDRRRDNPAPVRSAGLPRRHCAAAGRLIGALSQGDFAASSLGL